ncbi:hypothetical protein ACWEOZ_43830, partial [Actinoplanes sp. NPDC004185]
MEPRSAGRADLGWWSRDRLVGRTSAGGAAIGWWDRLGWWGWWGWKADAKKGRPVGGPFDAAGGQPTSVGIFSNSCVVNVTISCNIQFP